MHIHILGICGTFMGGLALVARQLGYKVTGADSQVYPPMSTQLREQGIPLIEGYDAAQLQPAPDLIVVGNAMSRGNPAIEYMLDKGLRYTSGPQFLSEHVLRERWVLAVAGTHGKTTTSSMAAWILEYAKLAPGFVIGGVPNNFSVSARLGDKPFFVIEADEYDTAFFDKRSKFVHYHPRTLIANNLEFDHADIFPDVAAIQRQFHHLFRIVPQTGLIVMPKADAHLAEVQKMGCWTPVEYIGDTENGWSAEPVRDDGSAFAVALRGKRIGTVEWSLMGMYNIQNALAAIAATRHAGVDPTYALDALSEFQNVKRRQELRGEVNGIRVYDDFAHHPTAVHVTLDGLRRKVGRERIIAVLEPRSNTMKLGVHKDDLMHALAAADAVYFYQAPKLQWNLDEVAQAVGKHAQVMHKVQDIVDDIAKIARRGDHVLIMSNGGFEGIHERVLEALRG
ncbi:MAG: UDP-N-acetylmuramate:L-alanyl-gamma-D-glutamyl-meso-diaminopimelate ligase [Pseudomonadota bacterium]